MAKTYQVSAPDNEKHLDGRKAPWWTSSRLGLAVLGFFGFINVYALRVNMSVSIVCMVNQTAIRLLSDQAEGNETEANNASNATDVVFEPTGCRAVAINGSSSSEFQDGELVWDKPIQGLVLGSFFWGYLVMQIPGGWLATKFGGKRIYGWGMFVAIILTMLTPIAAQTSYIFLIVIRILLGVVTGVSFPAMHALWGKWAPPLERSKLAAFTYAGAQVGNVITFPISGLLCKYGFAGGWPSIYYVLGAMSFVWFVLWMFLVSDSPAQHKRISRAEREYILTSLGDSFHEDSSKKIDVPWKSMFTSLPVFAIIVSNITSDWGAYTLMTNIPTYMNEVLKFDIASNGLYSALPYIGFWMTINVSGILADFVRDKRLLNTTTTRKAFDGFGKIAPAVMLIGLGYIDCTQPATALVLLTLGVCLTGFQYSGFVINHVDIAPAFAGILFGISNSIAAVTGFISPVIVGVVTKHDQSREQWQIVFYIAAFIYVAGAVFYIFFASGDLQSWARDSEESTIEKEQMNVSEHKPVQNGDIEMADILLDTDEKKAIKV